MRLIDADELDRRIYNDIPIKVFGTVKRMAAIREIIEDAPTVDAVPVLRGVWYKGPDSVIECSECHWFGKIDGYEYVYNFCPHCGADLREV